MPYLRDVAMRSMLAVFLLAIGVATAAAEPLPGTKPLLREEDLAAEMVAGIDRYLMRALAASGTERARLWKPDYSSPDAYVRSVQRNRVHLAVILGVVDARVPKPELEYIATSSTPALVAEAERYRIYAVRWPVLDGVDGEGLLLEPRLPPAASVIALPDADWTPEMLAGLAPGVPEPAQFARRLAENECRVLIPTLIDRQDTWSGNPRYRMTNQPHREYIYRMAYEMGRHIIGYEVQKVLAALDWLARAENHPPLGIYGYGEGGLLALASAALDTRVQAVTVSGYFGPRQGLWQEPIYRNAWAFLHEFDDARLADLVAPRHLVLEVCKGPELAGPPAAREGRSGAAPGRLQNPNAEAIDKEIARIGAYQRLSFPAAHCLTLRSELPGSEEALSRFLMGLIGKGKVEPTGTPPHDTRKGFDPGVRQHRQLDQLVAYTQHLLRDAEHRRQEFFWNKVDPSSLLKWQASCEKPRAYFWEEVIGKLPAPSEPANPRSRLAYDEPKWRGYEVTLDLYPDVFAYGILLLPRDLRPGERRPLVVCQHGLEGRPQDVVNPKVRTPYYNSFGAELANRGFIVYAPQNPYIGQDKFRVLQRKANPLKLSLFSFIVRQHERTLDWLASLPFVDPERMGFYGLSYGGKTAMRVPALLPRYALSICSGDFNEWIWKNVTVDYIGTYLHSGEYEMFEFDLGNTFNYAEMAALIAPRPFMVERGHKDGVGIDEYVAYEYAKVRRLYANLGVPERTAIEFFNSGHEINGQGTYAFLEKFLHWPK
jgi:dienelactone hydrolase